MGWENRKDRRYYYRKLREGDRVVSDYVGSGPLAELIALQDEDARLIEEWKRVGIELFQSDYEAAEAAYDALSEVVDERVDLVLTALGYRKRNGEWRRCRAARPSPSVEAVTRTRLSPNPPHPLNPCRRRRPRRKREPPSAPPSRRTQASWSRRSRRRATSR